MRLPKRGEKGFTLIELLIVVAILGVLAAVVIPNVGRFIGKGTEEAKKTELSNIQSATAAMMTDRNQPTITYPVGGGSTGDNGSTNNMAAFPDVRGNYILFGATVNISGTPTLVNYVATNQTAYYYTVDALGSVKQHTSANQSHAQD